MNRTFRIVWGLLTLASCGWIVYGIAATSQAVSTVVSITPSAQVITNAAGTPVATVDPKLSANATAAGAAIGGGLGLTFFICTGGIPLALFGFLYWRNGVAMRNAKQHAETIEALKSRPSA